MPCYYPRHGWRAKTKNESGKRSIVFRPSEGYVDMPVVIPCGGCIGCRLEKSRQWAIRISHEASLYDDNCFITFTYNDESLPQGGNLNKKHFTLFIKRLRKKYPDKKIRYYMAGEYGESCKTCKQNKINCKASGCNFDRGFGRPHYHAIIFNYKPKDLEKYGERNGEEYFTSRELQSLWTNARNKRERGQLIIGKVTFESAAYVARYTTKKVTGKNSKSHYKPIHLEDGSKIERIPEYSQMSKKPSIGKGWFDKYYLDIYRHDVMSVRCRNMRPPKYYDKEYEKIDPNRLKLLKFDRVRKSLNNPGNDYYRLLTKCELKLRKVKQLFRSYEDA